MHASVPQCSLPQLSVAFVNARGKCSSDENGECLWTQANSDLLIVVEADQIRTSSVEPLYTTLNGAQALRLPITNGNSMKVIHRFERTKRMIRGPTMLERYTAMVVREEVSDESMSFKVLNKQVNSTPTESPANTTSSNSSSSTSSRVFLLPRLLLVRIQKPSCTVKIVTKMSMDIYTARK